MKFKYYLITNNLDKAINFYTKAFGAKFEKQNGKHAKMVLFDTLKFLIYENLGTSPLKEGYLIIRFENHEVDLYHQTRKNIINAGGYFHIDNKKQRWGTTLSEFTDPFGYNWDLEISNDVIK